MSILLKLFRIKKQSIRCELILLMISIGLLLNILLIHRILNCSSSNPLVENFLSKDLNIYSISTIERSRKALENFKQLLTNVISPNAYPWIWLPTDEYPSVPYQPTSLTNKNIPKSISNNSIIPQSIKKEINRVCQRLKTIDQIGGDIWCKLFSKCYIDTIATTTTLLDDNSTYIITGDIDLMWLRDSSAQVHQYINLSDDPLIQRIIEGLIYRQIKFIYSNPYGSSFRLNLRSNPPSDDSLESIHTKKGRNIHVAMHNYELDSLCYFIRLSYTWWNKTKRIHIFNNQWLIAIKIIIQLMIIEQHHTEISPYRYTELLNNYKGLDVAYTGMIWTAFRPSDDQTEYGYLIPTNMMATVVLKQLSIMIKQLFSQEIQLLQQIDQLYTDILSGIHTYGVKNHTKYGQIYVYETDGFSQSLFMDDANVPSLLSSLYFNFQTPYDPYNQLIKSTHKFILSIDNPFYFQGLYGYGIGSKHTSPQYVWPMSIIMEGFTNPSRKNIDSVWTRLEISHAGTFSMHESFNIDDPKQFTRLWFAWVNSLFAELVLVHLDKLENWIKYRRTNQLTTKSLESL